MSYIFYNPNPVAANVKDCAVRAVAKALDIPWEDAYLRLMVNGYRMGDILPSDNVWGSVLRQNGFYKEIIPNTCPDCYTAADFCRDNPNGIFVLGFGGHVATVVDGDLYDSWDSSNLIPIYYWYLEEVENEQQAISTAQSEQPVTNSATGPNGAN